MLRHPADGSKYDQIRGTIVKVARPIPSPYQTRYIKYQLTLKDEDPAKIIPIDRRQTIQSTGDGRSATLIVQTMGPTDGEPGPESVGPEYLRPNGMITSEHDRVRRLAETIRRQRYRSLGAGRSDQSMGLSEPQKQLRDDLCPGQRGGAEPYRRLHRAFCPGRSYVQGLGNPCPCRRRPDLRGLARRSRTKASASTCGRGLRQPAMGAPLDSSFDQSSVDATHIKLSDSSLEGVSPFESFLPILRVQGKVTIDPVELR